MFECGARKDKNLFKQVNILIIIAFDFAFAGYNQPRPAATGRSENHFRIAEKRSYLQQRYLLCRNSGNICNILN